MFSYKKYLYFMSLVLKVKGRCTFHGRNLSYFRSNCAKNRMCEFLRGSVTGGCCIYKRTRLCYCNHISGFSNVIRSHRLRSKISALYVQIRQKIGISGFKYSEPHISGPMHFRIMVSLDLAFVSLWCWCDWSHQNFIEITFVLEFC
jgi:hypothetical protein